MPERESLSTRVARLENVGLKLAESHQRLDQKMAALIDAQIKTEQQLARVDEAARERDRQLDERIDKMVSAIGELIRLQRGNGNPSVSK